jgi:hypothetical protein
MNATRILTLVLAAVASQASAALADDFYQGKTLSLVVGYSAGGGYDINARLISRHIGRHIPGTPTVVVVNMPGAGSLRSVEHLERHAPKDGTVVNMFDLHPDHQFPADARQGPDRLPQVQMDRQRRAGPGGLLRLAHGQCEDDRGPAAAAENPYGPNQSRNVLRHATANPAKAV